MRPDSLRGYGPVGTNGPAESFDAVLAEMREWATGEGCFNDNPEGEPLPCVYWAQQPHLAILDRLQSAHARELAEQQATIEALRSEVAQEKFIAEAETMYSQDRDAHLADANARADAAMGLLRECLPYVRSWAQNKAGGVHYEQAAPVFALAEKAQQALAGGEMKDG